MSEKRIGGDLTLVVMLVVGLTLGAGIGYMMAPSEPVKYGWNNYTVKIRENQIMNFAEQYHYDYDGYRILFFYYPNTGTLYIDILQEESIFRR